MQAWLVVNEFLRNAKFKLVEEWFLQAARKYGIRLLVKTNAMFIKENQERPEFIIFWDKDVKLAGYWENRGVRVFNPAKAIAICDDKALTYMKLEKKGISMPKTIVAPMTYAAVGYGNFRFLDDVELRLRYPIILKECYGSFGLQVYKIENRKDMEDKMEGLSGKPLLFQEYIETSFARDVRLQVVGERVVAAMYRYTETGDFRANATMGGKMKPYRPTREQCELAIRASKAIGLDFAGVDLLFGEGDKPLLCEVNSNAHFKNLYDCTGINTADVIMEYIMNQIR